MQLWFAPIALFLDLLIVEPKGLPHPVELIGAVVRRQEHWVRRIGFDTRALGIALVAINALAAFVVVRILTAIPVFGSIAWIYFAYSGLALGQLLREGRRVNALLDQQDLAGARQALAGLVSRDVEALDDAGVRKALAETVSENLNDGFFAPFLYLVVGGPALMWAYKTVSTMDSLWGYKTPEYMELGYGAAKTDDILAWIPARLTAFAMMGAGKLLGKDALRAFDQTPQDAAKTDSPNAGWPMAAAAWLMDTPVGGDARYFGKQIRKPVLGPENGKTWNTESLKELLRLELYAGLLGGLIIYAYDLLLALAS